MAIKRKLLAVIFVLLTMLVIKSLYNAETMAKEQTDISVSSVTQQETEGLRLRELQGDELQKADLWLAEQNGKGLLNPTQ